MLRPDIENLPPYNVLRQEYADKFSLGYLNTDIKSKFALISLVGFLTYNFKKKKPSITSYQILTKVNDKLGLPVDFIKGISVVCEDFSYECKEFPTFGIKPKDMLKEIENILSSYIPF